MSAFDLSILFALVGSDSSFTCALPLSELSISAVLDLST